ncbi:helix-turn-helix transcriptional regulator [Streptomyces bathyalis]|uniref:Helix-turn-helix transcriptional regulator n=1 Tax=Streptomyces bathyalis TaxID=2710756 RepID=A0A7T1T694_9ACTN|nr:helix-turn-helix transcriptional regulator [Streptomyces bathyalis]QPP07159.1 helix-turn-helix transcriptional regulator [Streptomyces bathyalis]
MDRLSPYTSSDPRRPAFNREAARSTRQALGMRAEDVASTMLSAYGVQVTPLTVLSWESGDQSPGERELTALAGVLWCSVGDLMGSLSNVHQHRLARGVSTFDMALRLGLSPAEYEEMERSGRWQLTKRQAELLGDALALPLRARLDITGRDAQVGELLRRAVTTRWQPYVQPVCKLLDLPRARVGGILHHLHSEYQDMVGTVDWGGGTISMEPGEEGHAFLERLVDVFCARLEA